jgi:hypothetical protein
MFRRKKSIMYVKKKILCKDSELFGIRQTFRLLFMIY